MKITRNNENSVTVVLSESNVSELYHMMEQAKIERLRGRATTRTPFLLKDQASGQRLVVEVERDLTHYPIKAGA